MDGCGSDGISKQKLRRDQAIISIHYSLRFAPFPPFLPPSLLTALYSAMSEETVCPSSIIWFSDPPLKRG